MQTDNSSGVQAVVGLCQLMCLLSEKEMLSGLKCTPRKMVLLFITSSAQLYITN